MSLKDAIKTACPDFILPVARMIYNRYNEKKLANKILKSYPNEVEDPDLSEALDYLSKTKCGKVFPYAWTEKLPVSDPSDIEVFDDDSGMHFVMQDDKKLFFPRDMSREDVQGMYFGLNYLEQYTESPHCYLSEDFSVSKDSVIADCGVAEGNFSLSVVEKCKKLYLFEPDSRWIDPLKKTFSPWAEKVEIVPKYVSYNSGINTVSLDDFFADRECPDFIKMDVEGFEIMALEGAKKCFTSGKVLKAAICTYHKQDDYEKISKFLMNCDFSVSHSKGYMLFYWSPDFAPPYFRRGLIRAVKI